MSIPGALSPLEAILTTLVQQGGPIQPKPAQKPKPVPVVAPNPKPGMTPANVTRKKIDPAAMTAVAPPTQPTAGTGQVTDVNALFNGTGSGIVQPATKDVGSIWTANGPYAQAQQTPDDFEAFRKTIEPFTSINQAKLGFTFDDIKKKLDEANQLRQQAARLVPPVQADGNLRPGNALLTAGLAGLLQSLSGPYSNAGNTMVASVKEGNANRQAHAQQLAMAQHQTAQQQLLQQAQGLEQQASLMHQQYADAGGADSQFVNHLLSAYPWISGKKAELETIKAKARVTVAQAMADAGIDKALAGQLGKMPPSAKMALAPKFGITDPEAIQEFSKMGADDFLKLTKAQEIAELIPGKKANLEATANQKNSHADLYAEMAKDLPKRTAGLLKLWADNGAAATTRAMTGMVNARTSQGQLAVNQSDAERRWAEAEANLSVKDADIMLRKMTEQRLSYQKKIEDLELQKLGESNRDKKDAIDKQIDALEQKASSVTDGLSEWGGLTIKSLARNMANLPNPAQIDNPFIRQAINALKQPNADKKGILLYLAGKLGLQQ